MARRKVIKIDEEKCNGCGLCIPNCPEGAIQVIDGKAYLVSDLFCDGLGACIGHCPQGAITIEEREVEEYNERKVMENIVKQGRHVIRTHLQHLKDHKQNEYLNQAMNFLNEKKIKVALEDTGREHLHKTSGCPSAKVMDFRDRKIEPKKETFIAKGASQFKTWPVQIQLIPVNAPYFDQADLLIAADCVPFAYANFHEEILKGKVLLVGCPKLDDIQAYQNKVTLILKNHNIKSVTYAHMEVSCCFGLVNIIKSAILETGKDIPFKEEIISIKGERIK